jgi:hypothetical protein
MIFLVVPSKDGFTHLQKPQIESTFFQTHISYIPKFSQVHL